MSNWKCPFCGGNNLSTDRSCPGCGCLQSEAVTAEPKKAVGYYAGKPIYDVDEWIELGGHLADPGARLYSPLLPPTPRPLIPPKPEPDGVWIGGAEPFFDRDNPIDWALALLFGGLILLAAALSLGWLG